MKELKQYKEKHKLTWKEIAKEIGYSESYIANVMNGSRPNPTERFKKSVAELVKNT